ncbi:MAG: hypothetical protein AAFW64_03510 [Pseudomonadota bacterium]
MPRVFPICLVLLVAGSATQASPSLLVAPVPSEGVALKRNYLACEDAALAGRLDGAGIAACSVVYEDLKRTVFGGDFHRLRNWYETTRALERDTQVDLQLAD